MKFRIRFAKQVVGIFVLVAFAFLVFVLASMAVDQGWFRRDYYFRSQFNSADGLSVGMAVRFRGFQIGRVTEISLNGENDVDVIFFVEEGYLDKVREYSVVQNTSNPLGLGGGLEFHMGRSDSLLVDLYPDDEMPLVPSWDSKSARLFRQQDRVILPEQTDPIGSAISQLDPVLSGVNRTLDSLDTMLVAINQTLAGVGVGPVQNILVEAEGLMSNTSALVGSARSMVDETGRIVASTGEVVASVGRTAANLESTISYVDAELRAVMTEVRGIAANVQTLTAEFADPTGLVPRLLESDGSISRLFNDNNELYTQIESILAGLAESVGRIQEFSEFVSRTSPQITSLLEQGRRAIDTGQDVLEGVRNNPLIRGGIQEEPPDPTTTRSYRDQDF